MSFVFYWFDPATSFLMVRALTWDIFLAVLYNPLDFYPNSPLPFFGPMGLQGESNFMATKKGRTKKRPWRRITWGQTFIEKKQSVGVFVSQFSYCLWITTVPCNILMRVMWSYSLFINLFNLLITVHANCVWWNQLSFSN